MRRASARTWAGCAIAWLVACASTACDADVPTQIVVFVHSDMAVPSELDEMNVRVLDGSDTERFDRRIVLGSGAGAERLPVSFGLHPQGDDASRVATVEVEARHGGASLFTVRVATAFVRGEQRRLDIYLLRQCVDIALTCSPAETCGLDGCVPIAIDPRTLPPYQPGRASDAGIVIPPAPVPPPPPVDSGPMRPDAGECALQPCDVVGSCGCADGETCTVTLSFGMPMVKIECYEAGPRRLDEFCNPLFPGMTPVDETCGPGLVCVGSMTTPNACRLACHASSDCGDRALCRPIFLDASVTEAPFGACQSFCDPVYGPSCGDGQACRHGYTGAIESPMDIVLRTECGSAGPMRDGDCCVLDVDCEERTTCVPGAGGCAMGQCRPYCYLDDEVPTCAGGTFCQRLAGGPTYDGRELGACQ